MKSTENSAEFKNFDAALTKALSVSHDELMRREEKWKKQRKRKKRAKTSSRNIGVCPMQRSKRKKSLTSLSIAELSRLKLRLMRQHAKLLGFASAPSVHRIGVKTRG